MAEGLRFSVVIPTYNRHALVAACVEAFARQEGAPPFEVIVVDDGSSDGTAAALHKLMPPFAFTLVEQPNSGPAAARNHGAQRASGEILLFLDDDMEADVRLLAEHDRFHREGYDVVLGDIPLHPDSRPGFLSAAVGAWAADRSRALAERSGELTLHDLITGQMSVRRDAFLELGGFDTGFTQSVLAPNADLDFGHRLANAGFRIGFNPAAISRQRYVVTPRRYLRQWREAGQADVLFARKHPGELARIFPPHRRQRPSHRFRNPFRVPARWFVLGLAAAGAGSPRTTRWFYRVRDLEYHKGVREGGGIPDGESVRVLCYHAIANLKGTSHEQYGVPVRTFRLQLALLRRRFRFISARELVAFLDGHGAVPRRAVLVTFDDGFADLLDAGAPLLRRHAIPATVFAVTGRLGGTNDWSRPDAPRRPLLDADGLRRLAELGVTVGSHTRTHRILSGLGEDDLQDELDGSARDLERLGFGRHLLLAYPHGEHDGAVREAAVRAGYAAGLTVEAGIVHRGADRFALPRIEILRRDAGLRFLRKVLRGG